LRPVVPGAGPVATGTPRAGIACAADRNQIQERGRDHFDQLHPERTARKQVRRLERIGFEIEIERPVGRPASPPKPPMPSSSCPKCRHFGIAECIHMIERPRKTTPISNPQADSAG